ncbi:kinase-like domain-containing protein [Peziza echinospora]|nr:kinase-like domain-containing protein [Peziza echinospora]
MPTSDDYHLLEDIGRGSFGNIRKVKRKVDGVIMARKEISYARMNSKEKDQLTSEFGILSTVRHPNIVEYHHREHIKAEKMLYIYMEYCGNGDLAGLIRRCQDQQSSLREDVIWSIFSQLVCALYRCHYGIDPPCVDEPPPNTPGQVPPPHIRGKTVIHRDLKPENVFLDEDNFVKLGDFGLSKVLGPEQKLAMTFVGTPLYMSPELVSDSGYSHKTDIWSLGCIIYELCNLTTPFTARAQHILIQKIQEGRYSPIPNHYSPELRKAIDWCLRADPDLRPETAQLLYLPMMKISRKERDVVIYQGKVAAREEMCKLREAQIMSNEKEIIAKTREILAKEREIKRYLEERSHAMREQLNNEIRAEWKAKAEAEINHQVERARAELNGHFEYEVNRRVETILTQRLEHELARRILELNLVPANTLSSAYSSTSSQSSAPTSISSYGTPGRLSLPPAAAPESPADIDMASPAHWITPKERPGIYDQRPPVLDLRQNITLIHPSMQNQNQSHSQNQNNSLNNNQNHSQNQAQINHQHDGVMSRPSLLHQQSEPIHHANATMDDLFDEPDTMGRTMPAEKQNSIQHSRGPSLGSPVKRLSTGGLSRAHTATGVNLFPEARQHSLPPSGASDDFSVGKAASYSGVPQQQQQQQQQQPQKEIKSAASAFINLAIKQDQERKSEQAQSRGTTEIKRDKRFEEIARWDPHSEDAPSPFKKQGLYRR